MTGGAKKRKMTEESGFQREMAVMADMSKDPMTGP